MRTFLLMVSAVLAFAATMTLESKDANAVVCDLPPKKWTGLSCF